VIVSDFVFAIGVCCGMQVSSLGPDALLPILEDMYSPGSWWDCTQGTQGLSIDGLRREGALPHRALLGLDAGKIEPLGECWDSGLEEGRALAEWVEAGVGRYVVEESWVGGATRGHDTGYDTGYDTGDDTGDDWLGVPLEGVTPLDAGANSRWDGGVGAVHPNLCAPYSFETVRMSHCMVLGALLRFAVSITGSFCCWW